MFVGGGRQILVRKKRQRVTIPAVLTGLSLGLAVAATPIGLNLDGGILVFSPTAAFADDGKGGGKGGGKGNGKGDGNNTDGGGKPDATVPFGGDPNAQQQGGDRGVARAHFTTLISRRLPANQVSVLNDPNQAVSFFTEVRGMQGRTITHRWTYRGIVVYEASSTINGLKWRFWSTQILPADKPGTWKVDVVDEGDTVLQSRQLEYKPVG